MRNYPNLFIFPHHFSTADINRYCRHIFTPQARLDGKPLKSQRRKMTQYAVLSYSLWLQPNFDELNFGQVSNSITVHKFQPVRQHQLLQEAMRKQVLLYNRS